MANQTMSQLVWAAHGRPSAASDAGSGRCYVCCADVDKGATVDKWMGSNYTDQTRARNPLASHVCEACCYIHSRTSPVLGREPKEGKKFGGNFRNYSHLYEDGWAGAQAPGYANASKGEKPLIREFLAREHGGIWGAAIADSGQKHVLPFAPLNGPGRAGTVIFEEDLVHVPEDQSLIADMTALLTLGVTKDELGSGEWYVRTMRENRDAALAFEAKHGAMRGSGWYRLAIWLAQRDDEEFAAIDAARKEEKNAGREQKKKTGNARRRDDLGPKRRVSQRAKRAPGPELLGANPEQVPSGSAPVNDCERVGKRGAASSATAVPAQGRLPGID